MTSETHIPRFSGLFIPVRLLRTPDMNSLDKQLLAMIEVLSRRSVGCTATNAYLARACGVHETTISKTVARLEERSLLACSYAEDSHRTIRITRTACLLWLPDIEAGDTNNGGVGEPPTPLGETPSTCKSKSDKEESICEPSSSSSPPSNTQAGCAKTEYIAREEIDDDDDVDKSLRTGLATLGCTEAQAENILRTARANGRPDVWLRSWMAYASQHASKPAAYLQRMVEDNKPLPHTTAGAQPATSPATVDARSDAEWERTKRQNSREGYYRPTEEQKRESGFYAVKETLRKKIAADAEAKASQTLDLTADKNRETMTQVRQELATRGDARAADLE